MKKSKQPLSWVIYHPHQKLWNWRLIRGVRKVVRLDFLTNAIAWVIIELDTFLLFFKSRTFRISRLGLFSLGRKASIPNDRELIYLDIGTHEKGEELFYFVTEVAKGLHGKFRAFGFEASTSSYEKCRSRFEGMDNVEVTHAALCNTIPEGGKIRLYMDSDEGIADSIYRESERFEEVDAMRLSDFLAKRDLLAPDKIILLRMNIEGAEFDVLQNIVETGLTKQIAGFFGMWDDVSKIDVDRDRAFRQYMKENGIRTMTFNGRDMKWKQRKRIIRYQIHTCLLNDLKALKKHV